MVNMVMLYLFLFHISLLLARSSGWEVGTLISASRLTMFVDELPDMPRIRGFDIKNGVTVAKSFKIGMFEKKWKFHRDLPLSRVLAYGTSRKTATVPGPTIEAIHGVDTYVTWQNHLPSQHILPWDPTIPTAIPVNGKGIPTVVHLHGGIDEPESDGNSNSWFTAGFKDKGPQWTKKKYHYHNAQHPGNLWYHDHAMGLTRVNLLAGLIGSYIIRDPGLEVPLGLPHGDEFDRPLVVFDHSFRTDGSIYMNSTGNNPSIHPQWQPEYFGDAIIVNGKAWPRLTVRYRFRILNASNARFFCSYGYFHCHLCRGLDENAAGSVQRAVNAITPSRLSSQPKLLEATKLQCRFPIGIVPCQVDLLAVCQRKKQLRNYNKKVKAGLKKAGLSDLSSVHGFVVTDGSWSSPWDGGTAAIVYDNKLRPACLILGFVCEVDSNTTEMFGIVRIQICEEAIRIAFDLPLEERLSLFICTDSNVALQFIRNEQEDIPVHMQTSHQTAMYEYKNILVTSPVKMTYGKVSTPLINGAHILAYHHSRKFPKTTSIQRKDFHKLPKSILDKLKWVAGVDY